MTWSMSLYAAGISSMNASVSRYSMPVMASRSCSCVNSRRAADREWLRPAPCGDEFSESASPLPVTTYDAVPIDPGISPASPTPALIAPLRDTHTCLPKCVSCSVKLWWQLTRSASTTGSPMCSEMASTTRSIISSRLSSA